MHIDKDLIAASATPLVLAILAEGESYGYAILKRVRALSAGDLEWTDGMLYPLLHRLSRLGYVTTEWRTPPEVRRRKYYALTDEGRAALAEQQRQWLAVTRTLNDVWPGAVLRPPARHSHETLESQIADWRAYVESAPGVNGRDVDELEDHLRHQIADLNAAGLTADEGFLIAVKRLGDVDGLSREFAREHSGRLWKQLLLRDEDEPLRSASGWVETVVFAVAAAVVVQIARLAAEAPDEEPTWLVRNASLFVLPFLAGYFAHRRRLDARGWALTAAPFVLAALLINLYPYGVDSATEILVALHLPVVLWFAVAYPYMGGTVGSHERRMDFVRFTGEWFIYYVLIALGGGVLMGLTAAILEPTGVDVERIAEWVLPSGAAGAVIVAAWLVESKQRVVENMAPVLTMMFTPLFAVMLAGVAVVYAVTGLGGAFDRDLVSVLDALLVVVLALVLYGMSARDPSTSPEWMDGSSWWPSSAPSCST